MARGRAPSKEREMAKDRFDYFKAFEEITALCCQEAETLLESMKTFDPVSQRSVGKTEVQ